MKFYQMSIEERRKFLGLKEGFLPGDLSLDVANVMIENVVGVIELPVGVVFMKINGEERTIPMAIEEASVIAAANKASKMALPKGFEAWADEPVMIGQVQFKVSDSREALEQLNASKEELEELLEDMTSHLKKYGGGFRGLRFKALPTQRGEFVVLEFLISTGDAMGANTINTIAEELGLEIERRFGFEYRLRILSNLAIYRKAYSKAHWSFEKIEEDARKKGFSGEEAVERFLDGYTFAREDVFRLTTSNKGIMNGVDAVALATGQDWRAIEAGAHMYSSWNGFKPLATYWKAEDGGIMGRIEMPIQVGTVGGSTGVLPHAKHSFLLMKVKNARELAAVMASVGLANNFAAIYALSTEGIQKGHMKLHVRSLAIMAGATPEEAEKLKDMFEASHRVRFQDVKEALSRLRGER